MEKEFVPPEQALDLEKLGFNEPCFGYHNMVNHSGEFKFDTRIWEYSDNYINAPLYQQAFRFFREKYGLWFRPDYYDESKEYNFQGSIHELGKYNVIADIGNYKTPEEAELACLKKLIEIVKTKQNG
jgi:hypothetical protein